MGVYLKKLKLFLYENKISDMNVTDKKDIFSESEMPIQDAYDTLCALRPNDTSVRPDMPLTEMLNKIMASTLGKSDADFQRSLQQLATICEIPDELFAYEFKVIMTLCTHRIPQSAYDEVYKQVKEWASILNIMIENFKQDIRFKFVTSTSSVKMPINKVGPDPPVHEPKPELKKNIPENVIYNRMYSYHELAAYEFKIILNLRTIQISEDMFNKVYEEVKQWSWVLDIIIENFKYVHKVVHFKSDVKTITDRTVPLVSLISLV